MMYDSRQSMISRAISAAGKMEDGVLPYGDHLRREVSLLMSYAHHERQPNEQQLARIVFLAWQSCVGDRQLCHCLTWAWGEVMKSPA